MFPDGNLVGPHANTDFDPSLEYSKNKALLLWRPPPYFSPWSPSSFVVDDVSYCCAEQYVMAEKVSCFQDHQEVELTMSPPYRSTHKCSGGGVQNFDSAVGDRESQNSVLAGTYAKFTPMPAMKNHLSCCGT